MEKTKQNNTVKDDLYKKENFQKGTIDFSWTS